MTINELEKRTAARTFDLFYGKAQRYREEVHPDFRSKDLRLSYYWEKVDKSLGRLRRAGVIEWE